MVEIRMAAPRSCPEHRGASAAKVIIRIEIRKNFDIEFFMAARSWSPPTPSDTAGATLSSREEYTRKLTRIHG
jgi:hypothetical protein